MSALKNKIQSVVAKYPMVVAGRKLPPQEAEQKVHSLLADERIGILSDDPDTHSLLSFVSERDIRTVFCDEAKVAVPFVKAFLANVGGSSETQDKPNESGSMVKALKALIPQDPGQMKTKELLEIYDADASESIWSELKARSKNQPCIIFCEDGSIDMLLTLAVFRGIRKGETYGGIYHDGDIASRLYPIGVFPQESVLVCPITGNTLSNGYCSDLKVSWRGIGEDEMVFIRVIRDQNPNENFGRVALRGIINTAKAGMTALREEFSEEALVYDEMKELNQLPSLRINRNSLVAGRRMERKGTADPFGSPKRI